MTYPYIYGFTSCLLYALYDNITVYIENVINKLDEIIIYQSKNIEALKEENNIIIHKLEI